MLRLSRASQAIDTETTIGGHPNQLFARYGSWLDDHEKLVDRVFKCVISVSLITTGIWTVYNVHQFSMKYVTGSFMPLLWTAAVRVFAGIMLYASYCETMAKRRGAALRAIGMVPITLYCACAYVPIPKIVGTILVG
ncbi:MAG: hypothetical protein WCF33_16485 [Pseudonocardiaceae bacterium]